MSSVVILLASGVLFACGQEAQQTDAAPKSNVASDSITSYSGNGAQIYYTGRTSSGSPVTVIAPSALGDGTPSLACVDCHGADGRGLNLATTSGVLQTPDITYDVLTTPQVYRSDRAYNDATLGLTLRSGVRVDGYTLNPQMPRWNLSPEDMTDLILHLKSLSSASAGDPR
jgi:hypothetical protein